MMMRKGDVRCHCDGPTGQCANTNELSWLRPSDRHPLNGKRGETTTTNASDAAYSMHGQAMR